MNHSTTGSGHQPNLFANRCRVSVYVLLGLVTVLSLDTRAAAQCDPIEDPCCWDPCLCDPCCWDVCSVSCNPWEPDCNGNWISDQCDLQNGGYDCDWNGVIDSCELADGTAADCDGNGVIDSCEESPPNCGSGTQNLVLLFPQTGSNVEMPHSDIQNAPIIAGSMTIEFWIRFESGASGRVVSKRGCSFAGFTIHAAGQADGAFFSMEFGTGVVELDYQAGLVPKGEWHHVAFTWDHSIRQIRFIVDGVLLSELETEDGDLAGASSNPLRFGGTCGWFTTGALDNIRYWSVARSVDQVRASRFEQFTAEQAASEPGLVGSWTFDGAIPLEDGCGLNPLGWFGGWAQVVQEALPTSPCTGDLFEDGTVDGTDLALLLPYWGVGGQGGNADLDGDGVVGGSDLALLLTHWGSCSQ